MQTCVFCKIARREIPADLLHEDEQMVAFRDIHPQAPVHILIVPRRHIESVLDLSEADGPLIGSVVMLAAGLARRHGVAESGFRLVCNTGAGAGQTVPHLHIHLLGGRPMTDPPG